MDKDPISIINTVSGRILKKASGFLSKVISRILGFSSAVLFICSLAFLIGGFTSFKIFFPISVLFIIPAIFFAFFAYKINREAYGYSKQHYVDIKSCQNILQKIKDQYGNEKKISKEEFNHIFDSMKKELKNARVTTKKIDSIISVMKTPDFDLLRIDKKISEEKIKVDPDENRIKTLMEQKENIKVIEKRVKNLQDEISNLRLNFNSIFTKLTLINTRSKTNYDEIETDIQKILDFKLHVSKYEEELSNDLE